MNYADVRDLILTAIRNKLNRDHTYNGKVSVTSAISCLRKSFFRYYMGTDIITDENWGNLITGHALHEYIQKLLSNLRIDGIDFDFEVRVENEILIGYIDAVLTTNGESYLLEFKSARDIPTKPFGTHVLQLNTYLYLVDSSLKVDRGFIVYLPKTSPTMRVYQVTRDPDKYQYVLRRAEILKECIESKKIPPAEMNDKCWFCPFVKTCRAYEKGEINAEQIL